MENTKLSGWLQTFEQSCVYSMFLLPPWRCRSSPDSWRGWRRRRSARRCPTRPLWALDNPEPLTSGPVEKSSPLKDKKINPIHKDRTPLWSNDDVTHPWKQKWSHSSVAWRSEKASRCRPRRPGPSGLRWWRRQLSSWEPRWSQLQRPLLGWESSLQVGPPSGRRGCSIWFLSVGGARSSLALVLDGEAQSLGRAAAWAEAAERYLRTPRRLRRRRRPRQTCPRELEESDKKKRRRRRRLSERRFHFFFELSRAGRFLTRHAAGDLKVKAAAPVIFAHGVTLALLQGAEAGLTAAHTGLWGGGRGIWIYSFEE